MKTFKVSIPRRVSFTDCEVFYVEAESEQEAINQVNESNDMGEFESQGDYETEHVYETEAEEIQHTEAQA
jgi:hypothetical protein